MKVKKLHLLIEYQLIKHDRGQFNLFITCAFEKEKNQYTTRPTPSDFVRLEQLWTGSKREYWMKYCAFLPLSVHFGWHLTHFSKTLFGLKISQNSPACSSDNCSVEWRSVPRLRCNTIFSQTFITYFLTLWRKVLLEKLTGSQLVKKFPAFYGARRFITPITSTRHPFLSWARFIQSITPHHISWRFFLTLQSRLCLGFPSGLFPSDLPTKTLYATLLSTIRARCPAHVIILDLISRTILGEQYRSLISSLCSFLHSPVTLSLLGPNILLNTLFSNTLSLRSSLNVSDQDFTPIQNNRQNYSSV